MASIAWSQMCSPIRRPPHRGPDRSRQSDKLFRSNKEENKAEVTPSNAEGSFGDAISSEDPDVRTARSKLVEAQKLMTSRDSVVVAASLLFEEARALARGALSKKASTKSEVDAVGYEGTLRVLVAACAGHGAACSLIAARGSGQSSVSRAEVAINAWEECAQVASTLNDRNSAADALLAVADLHETCGELQKASHAASAALLLSDPASVASSGPSSISNAQNSSGSSGSSTDVKPSTPSCTTTEPQDWARAWAASKLLGHVSARKGHWAEARRYFEVSAGAASSLVALGGVPPFPNDNSAQHNSRFTAAAAIADADVAAGPNPSSDGDPSAAATWVRREALALEQVALTGAKASQQANETADRLAYARDIEFRPRNSFPVPAATSMARDPALEAIAAASAANNPNKSSHGGNSDGGSNGNSGKQASPRRELFLARTFDGASEAQARAAEFQKRGDEAEARAAAKYGVVSRGGSGRERGTNNNNNNNSNSSEKTQQNDSVDYLSAAASLAETARSWDGGGSGGGGRSSGAFLASRLGHQASAARWQSGDPQGARVLRQRLATAKLGSHANEYHGGGGGDGDTYEKLPVPPGPTHGGVGPGALRFYPSEASLELAGVPGPGPGHYSVAAAAAPPTGGKFSNAVPKTDIDWTMMRAAQVPGMGSYEVRPMWGATTGPRVTPGGKFMASQRGSALDHTLLEAAHKPGPGAYDDHSRSGLATPGGKFSTTPVSRKFDEPAKLAARGAYSTGGARVLPSTLDLHGGNFNKGNPKSDLEWKILRSKEIPAPGGDWTLPTTLSGGFHFNQGAPKSDVEWAILRAQDIPGPGAYAVPTTLQKTGGSFNHSYTKPFVPKKAKTLSFRDGSVATSATRSNSLGSSSFENSSIESSVKSIRASSTRR